MKDVTVVGSQLRLTGLQIMQIMQAEVQIFSVFRIYMLLNISIFRDQTVELNNKDHLIART